MQYCFKWKVVVFVYALSSVSMIYFLRFPARLERANIVVHSQLGYQKQAQKEDTVNSNITTNGAVHSDLTIMCSSGMLGNKMFFYAVLFSIARSNHRKAYVQPCNINTCWNNANNCKQTNLYQIFNLSLPIGQPLPLEKQRSFDIHFHSTIPNDFQVPKVVNIISGEQWPVSVTHFLHIREDIRREFRFKDNYLQPANRILTEIKGLREKINFVGIHVRRGDYLRHLDKYKRNKAPLEFYNYGLKYYRMKYVHVLFVVTSDDLEWCRENLKGNDIFIPNVMSSNDEDLALLSNCNHTLFDYGTFGFWAAFLAGGEALYFVDGIVDSSNKDVLQSKLMYPPDWNGISIDMLKVME